MAQHRHFVFLKNDGQCSGDDPRLHKPYQQEHLSGDILLSWLVSIKKSYLSFGTKIRFKHLLQFISTVNLLKEIAPRRRRVLRET